ncbi:urease accessory protein UreF [Oceanobacillus sp. FSL K6-2867]|uniref:urease accessory protein UreF n=1 Tax=Oceanobacillus sp. FSL K6-2867 TaxID=2954748 RepID=UPI0030DD3A28
MIDRALALFQLCDSNFPTGSFSHSFGLETYIQENLVHDKKSFSKWLKVYLHEQLVFSDGLASRLAYEALVEGDLDKVWELDRLLTVQNLARESREGTQRMGERMLTIVEELYKIPITAEYRGRIKEKRSFGHSALVFTMVGHYLQVEKEMTIRYYLYSTIAALVQNAVRAIPLGQTTGQQIIHDFQKELVIASEKIMKLDSIEFGIVSPGLELAQMEHERVNVRIFMS